MSPPSSRAPRSATPDAPSSLRRAWSARSARCSCSATAPHAVPLVPAQDFKRVGDGDAGPNTGGMGAYAPMPHVDGAGGGRHHGHGHPPAGRGVAPPWHRLPRRALRRPHADRGGPQGHRVQRALRGPRGRGGAAAVGRRRRRALPRRGQRGPGGSQPPAFSDDAAVCVVLASQGYPESPRTGDTIEGLDSAGQSVAAVDGATVFHAGTRRHGPDGPFYTAGGRVLAVTAVAPSVEQAREHAYAAAEPIDWEGMQMRHDIAALVPGAPVAAGEGGR